LQGGQWCRGGSPKASSASLIQLIAEFLDIGHRHRLGPQDHVRCRSSGSFRRHPRAVDRIPHQRPDGATFLPSPTLKALKLGLVQHELDSMRQWHIQTLPVHCQALLRRVVGAVISGKVHPDRLRKGFGWFVLVMAVFILFQELGSSIIEFAQGSAIQMVEVVAGVIVLVVGITVLIRWPAKEPLADFDTTGGEITRDTDDASQTN
jgi:uncharacterized membrane protein